MKRKFTLKKWAFQLESLEREGVPCVRKSCLPMFILFAFVMFLGIGGAWAQTDPCAKNYDVCSGGSVVLTHDASCGNGGNYVWAAFEDDGNYFYNGVYTAPTIVYTATNFGTGGIGGGWGDGENPEALLKPGTTNVPNENRCHYPGSMTVDIKNSTSNNPYIYFPISGGADPNIYRYFIIRYRVNYNTVNTDLGNMELYFFNSNNTNTATPSTSYRVLSRHITTPSLGQLSTKCSTEGYVTVYVDAWDNTNWKTGGNITGFRLDPISVAPGNNQVHMSIDYIGLVSTVPPSPDNTLTLNNVTANMTMKSYQINTNGSVTVTTGSNPAHQMENAAGKIYYGWTSTESIHDVQVNPELNAGAIATGNAERCYGDATAIAEIEEATAASQATDATLSYKWYVSKDGGTPTVIPDATLNTFTPDINNYKTASGTYVFTRVVISSLCEDSPKTSDGTFTLVVKPEPVVNPVSNQTFYTNDGVKTVNFTSTVDGVDFAWTNSNTAIGLAAESTGNISFTPTNNTPNDLVANISVTPKIGNCLGTPMDFTITVKNSVTMNDITDYMHDACSGTDVIAAFTSEIDGVSYSWSHTNTNVTPTSGTVSADANGNFSQAFTNSTNAAQTVTFSVTPTKGGVSGAAKTFEVTINPLPTVTITAPSTLCLEQTASLSATTDMNTYAWESASAGAGLPATTNTASITVTPTAAGEMTYKVTVVDANGCENNASTNLTVNAAPTISATNATQSITYGESIEPVVITSSESTVALSTLPDGLSYDATTKTISGAPDYGTHTITATADNAAGCGPVSTEIKITVGKKNLTVSGTKTKVYDGTPLTINYNELTYDGLIDGDVFTAGTVTTDGYKVGTYVCNAGSFNRELADLTATVSGFLPAEVTANYAVTFNVTLTIDKRPLEITANSATKEYDATPLKDDGYTFTNSTSLASTDEATVTVTGEQLCNGSSLNTVGNVVITHTSDNEDVTDCYTITKKTGTLTVTPLTCPASVSYQGYTYPTVQIGNQCWLAENLRADGGVAYKGDNDNMTKFGYLYDWTAALSSNGTVETDPCLGNYVQGICPDGWGIPTAADFNTLQNTASSMKDIRSDNTQYWLPSYVGDNTTGFDERGGGFYNSATARYEELLTAAYFWTSESLMGASYGEGMALAYVDEYYCDKFIPKVLPQNSKLSVRCIQKTVSDIPATSFNLEVSGPDKVTFCASSETPVTATYTAVLTPAVSPVTYQWYVNGSAVSGAQSATFVKSYTSADAGTAVIKCEATATGTTQDGSVSTEVLVLGPYSSEITQQVCDCLLPYSFTIKDWTVTWADAAEVASTPTKSHTFTTADGCDSVVSITLKTWSASSETPTNCTGVTSYRSNETGNGSGLETVSDVDGNVYHVVQIGNQCWMKENLRVKHFADGTALVGATSVNEGHKANIYYTTSNNIYSKGPCDDEHGITMAQHTEKYGLMYNWYTAMHAATDASGNAIVPDFGLSDVQGICPDGWHLPDTAEWQTLERSAGFYGQHSETEHIFVGNSAIQLVTGCEWKQSNVSGTPGDYSAMGRNATNFSVRPAGCFLDVAHDVDGTHYDADQFAYAGIWAFFWSSTRFKHPDYPDSGAAYNYDITFDKAGIARDVNYRDYLIGRSVRCIRNND